MAGKYRYVPLLRTKTGESTALALLSSAARARTYPVLHIVKKPPAKFADAMIAAWVGMPMALDGTYTMDQTGSATDFTQMFDKLGKGKINVVPSIWAESDPARVAVVSKMANRYAPGLVVKVRQNQLANAAKWVAGQSWKASDIDLVIDLGEVAGYDPTLLEPVVTQSLASIIPGKSPWRSITLAGSSAPKDHGGIPLGRSLKPRIEAKVWSGSRAKLNFQLDYGDYASGHPDLTEPPGMAMTNATVSARYAIDDDWIVLKGRPTKGKTGQPMEKQYRAHAKTLKAEPKFGGVNGCWADDHIVKIAGGPPVKAGNRGTWASLAVNRHLSLIADRLP